MEKVDITVIGAGVAGLAVANHLSLSGRSVFVVEKNESFGQETSSRNSEVIHGGLYYLKDSLKALTCVRGRELLYDFCAKNNLPAKKTGKLVVAWDDEGVASIDNIYKNAVSCGVKDLRFFDNDELKSVEPVISVKKALYSPDSGIIDVHSLMKYFYNSSHAAGADYVFKVEVTGIKKKNGLYEIEAREADGSSFSFLSGTVINCAGLMSDKIAAMVGIDIIKSGYKLHFSKGQYFRINDPGKFPVKHLVYPPPLSTSLGIHLVLDFGDGLRLGPDANYVSEIDYNINESDKIHFYESVIKFLPNLEVNDLSPDTCGIRPKLQGKGEPFRDFVIKEESDKGYPHFINLIGIDSPGLTSCLAIAEKVADLI